jgi:hypothetical protein
VFNGSETTQRGRVSGASETDGGRRRHCSERHRHARRHGRRRPRVMDVRPPHFFADRARDGFSGRSRRRRTETLSRPFHIDQALLPKGARGGSLAGTVPRPRSSRGDVAGEDVADGSHAFDDPRLVRWSLELARLSTSRASRSITRRNPLQLHWLNALLSFEGSTEFTCHLIDPCEGRQCCRFVARSTRTSHFAGMNKVAGIACQVRLLCRVFTY